MDTARRNSLAMARIDEPEAIPREMSSPLGKRECQRRPPTGYRGNSAMTRQQKKWTTVCCLPQKPRPISCSDCPVSSGLTSRSAASRKASIVSETS